MKAIAVKAIISDISGKILLLKRSDTDRMDGGLWDLPGGRTHFNETNESALKREVEEETGLRVVILSLHSQWYFEDENAIQVSGFTYLCRTTQEPQLNVSLSKEHSAYQWINPAHIELLQMKESLKADIKKLL